MKRETYSAKMTFFKILNVLIIIILFLTGSQYHMYLNESQGEIKCIKCSDSVNYYCYRFHCRVIIHCGCAHVHIYGIITSRYKVNSIDTHVHFNHILNPF